MRMIRLGRTGVQVPSISLGTWSHGGPADVNGRPVGWYGTDPVQSRETLLRAHELGISHWDTADVYGEGESERRIGAIWRQVRRSEVFLASKVGWNPGEYDHYYHPRQIRKQLELSLRNLRTEYIDLYYLHHCDFGSNDEYLDGAVECLRRFRDEGKVRFIGLSDWRDDRIRRYGDRVDPDVVQGYRNVVDDTYESAQLKEWAEARDTGVCFFSPLKHGLLMGKLEGPVTFGNGDHRNAIPEFRDFALLSRLRSCRRELQLRFPDHPEPVLHGLTGALLSTSKNACVLIGMRRPEHAMAAAAVGQDLDEESAQWVRQLYQEHGRCERPAWRRNRRRA